MRDCRSSLLEVDIKLVEPKSVFGSVEYGILTVKGKLRRALWHGNTADRSPENQVEEHREGPTGDDTYKNVPARNLSLMRIMPDAGEADVQGPLDVYLLEVGNCVGSKKRGPVGLVLGAMLGPAEANNRSTPPPRFTRLGVFHLSKEFALPESRKRRPIEAWDKMMSEPLESEVLEEQLKWFEGARSEAVQIM